MKKRIIGVTLLTVVCALLLSNLVGVLIFCSREMDAARDTLQELLVLMDAQSAITEPEALAEQFHAAAPDKRLTIIDTDGTVLADTDADASTLEDIRLRDADYNNFVIGKHERLPIPQTDVDNNPNLDQNPNY